MNQVSEENDSHGEKITHEKGVMWTSINCG